MSLFNAYMTLSGAYDAEIERDRPLSRLTMLRVGGTADLVARVHSYHALVRVLEVLKAEGVPWSVLGRGASVLAADEGYRGCVILLGREFSRVSVDEEAAQLNVGAAVLLSKAVNAAYMSGLAGLEPFCGLPGTVGGALATNVGDRKQWLGSRVQSLVCYHPGTGLVRYQADDLEWGLRQVSLPPEELVLEATFALEPDAKAAIGQRADRVLAERRRTQAAGVARCDGIFLDPPGTTASQVLAAAGFCGRGVGGARVSPAGANYVVNDGTATAREVLYLINEMQTRAKEGQGVQLQPKIKFLGFSS